MSYAAERWARAQVAGNARAKAVLIELANCFNEGTGLCCPSAASIARVTELKADTVFSAIDHLVRCGLIRKATSVGTSNRYILVGFNPDEWPAKKDDKPTPKTGHPRKRGTPENGVPTYPENGVTPYPEFGVLTGNRNREEEQGNVVTPALEKPTPKTGYPENGVGPSPDDWASLLAEPAPMEDDYPADLFGDVIPDPAPDAAPASKPAPKRSTRAKPKRLCPFDLVAVIPDDWRDAFAADFPSLDLGEEFRKFVGWHLAKGNAYADWKAAFRNWLGNAVKFQARDRNYSKDNRHDVQASRQGSILTPQSEYDYAEGLRIFEARRAARRARDA